MTSRRPAAIAPPSPRRAPWPVAPLALAVACAAAPPRLAAPDARVELRAVRVREPDPAIRGACEGAVAGALRRRGFALAPGGTSVRVEVNFWDQTQDVLSRTVTSTADLTATLRGAGEAREVIASATSGDVRTTGGPMSVAGRSRIAACEAGAERLADALAEEFATRRR